MGVIDSLSAGYRFVTVRIYLLILPVLLDVLLWNLPRLSIASLFERLARLYEGLVQVDEISADLVTMTEQIAVMLVAMGEQSNLFNLLVNRSLLHVPSIFVFAGPLSAATPWEISNLWTIASLIGFLSLLSVFVGVVYLGLLAEGLPIGSGGRSRDWVTFVLLSFRRWWRIILFALALSVALFVLMIPLSLGLTLLALLSPGLASGITMLLSGLIFVIFFYLYFVTAGLVMDDLSVKQAVTYSVRIIRNNFWSAFVFIVLINLISLGFSLLLVPLVEFVPIGTLAAILLNAYIGSGLAMALLVFYRTRALMLNGSVTLDEIMSHK